MSKKKQGAVIIVLIVAFFVGQMFYNEVTGIYDNFTRVQNLKSQVDTAKTDNMIAKNAYFHTNKESKDAINFYKQWLPIFNQCSNQRYLSDKTNQLLSREFLSDKRRILARNKKITETTFDNNYSIKDGFRFNLDYNGNYISVINWLGLFEETFPVCIIKEFSMKKNISSAKMPIEVRFHAIIPNKKF